MPSMENEPPYETDVRMEISLQYLEHLPEECQLFVFGSTARGAARSTSDLDLMVTTPDLNSSLATQKIPGLPQLSSEQLAMLPPDVTNISFENSKDGIPVHIEVYSEEWLKKLIDMGAVGRHRSAIYDPNGNFHKKDFGKQPTIRGEVKHFPRNLERIGDFVVFDDHEPEDATTLRIEHRKLMVSEPLRVSEEFAATIQNTREVIIQNATQALGSSVSLEGLVHVFGRVKDAEIVPAGFSENKRNEVITTLGLQPEIDESYELLRPLPASLRVSITDRCNLRCVYCMGEGTVPKNVNKGQDMDPEAFKKIAVMWHDMGGHKLKFTGGEPFLDRNLPDYIKTCAELGLDVSITTNGYFLTAEKLDLLAKYNVSLVVSMDTIAEGNKSKMSPVGKPARAIADRVVAAREFGLDVSVNTVLTTYSKESVLFEMIPWAIEHDIKLRVLEEGTVIEDRTTESHESLDSFIMQVSEKYGLEIVDRGEYGDKLALLNGKPVIHFLTSFCGRQDADSCGENSIRVDSQGRAVPCMMGGEHMPIESKKDLAQAINSQGTCQHGVHSKVEE